MNIKSTKNLIKFKSVDKDNVAKYINQKIPIQQGQIEKQFLNFDEPFG